MALVIDTGVLYAALDTSDPDHVACVSLLAGAEEQLVVPLPVLVELEYLVGRSAPREAWLAFCEDVAAGAYALWQIDGDLLVKCARLQVRFADQAIGFVDAAVFATCEALGENKVATLDVRHFSVLRTERGQALRLLPD